MSDLTKEERETFNVSLCRPETYLSILENINYYQVQGNIEATNAFLSLKTKMEQKCDMTNIHRSLGMNNHSHIIKPEPKKITVRGMETYTLNEDGSLGYIPPEENTVKIPEPLNDAQLALRALTSKNYEEEHRKTLFPETCTAACPHRQCPYYRLENFGKPCEKQQAQYKTPPSQFEKRTLDPNEPDYHSPQFRDENLEKPRNRKEMKESLSPM